MKKRYVESTCAPCLICEEWIQYEDGDQAGDAETPPAVGLLVSGQHGVNYLVCRRHQKLAGFFPGGVWSCPCAQEEGGGGEGPYNLGPICWRCKRPPALDLTEDDLLLIAKSLRHSIGAWGRKDDLRDLLRKITRGP